MNQITVNLMENSHFKEILPFLFPSTGEVLAKRGIVFSAALDGTTCGALGAVEEDGVLKVVSLFVNEPCRGRGVAGCLVREAEQYAENRGLSEINFSYSAAEEKVHLLDRFFAKNGYPMPLAGNTLFTLSLENLKDSTFISYMEAIGTLANIYPLRSLGGQTLTDFQARTGSEIPSYLTLEEAVGKPLHDLCLAYVKNCKVTAFITMTEVKGVLHLNSVYLSDEKYTVHLLSLIKQAYTTVLEKYPHFQTMTVTSATKSSYNLIEKLLEGVHVYRKTVYTVSKSLFSYERTFVPTGFEEALVRFQAITDVLTEKGVSSSLVVYNGSLPYMEIPLEDTDFVMGLYYDAKSNKEEEGFTFIAECVIAVEDENLRNCMEAKINEENEPYYCIVSSKGEILLRGMFEVGSDAGGMDMESIVDTFVLPFQAYAKCMMRFL